MSKLTELFEPEGEDAGLPRPVTAITEDNPVSNPVPADEVDAGVAAEVEFLYKVATKGSSVKKNKSTKGPVSFADNLTTEYAPDGSYVMSPTGVTSPHGDGDRTKSVDFRGQDMSDLSQPSKDDDDGNPQTMKESYKAMLRRRGARKGRRFRESEAQVFGDDDVTKEGDDQDYNEETQRLHRRHDELQLEVYNLDFDISQKTKLLEQKRRELREVADQLEHRPKSAEEMEEDHGADESTREFAGLKDAMESSNNNNNNNNRGRSSRIESAALANVRESGTEGSIKIKEHGDGGGALRVLVMKLNKFSKNTPRVLELNSTSKIMSLYKVKEAGAQYKIDATMIVSATLVPNNPLQMRFVFFASSQRLLRSEKDWRLKFETTFERERVYRLIKEILIAKQGRGASFNYKPQPLPISKSIQNRVDALPVRKLAEQLHVVWNESKAEKGWRYSPQYDEKAKTHPEMCPFEELGKEQQAYDLGIANLTLAGIFELGYNIQKAREGDAAMAEQLNKLIEFLAENAHESWAANKMKQGWGYGAKTDVSSKAHSQLVPYADMTDEEKDSDREAAITIISTLIHWGYGIQKATVDV